MGLVLAGPPQAWAKTLYDKPVYYPESGSYYELVKVTPGYSVRGENAPEINWNNARRLAAQRTHKGIRGRLAVVKSRAVHEFLRKTFKPCLSG